MILTVGISPGIIHIKTMKYCGTTRMLQSKSFLTTALLPGSVYLLREEGRKKWLEKTQCWPCETEKWYNEDGFHLCQTTWKLMLIVMDGSFKYCFKFHVRFELCDEIIILQHWNTCNSPTSSVPYFSQSIREAFKKKRQKKLTFVILGGGVKFFEMSTF